MPDTSLAPIRLHGWRVTGHALLRWRERFGHDTDALALALAEARPVTATEAKLAGLKGATGVVCERLDALFVVCGSSVLTVVVGFAWSQLRHIAPPEPYSRRRRRR